MSQENYQEKIKDKEDEYQDQEDESQDKEDEFQDKEDESEDDQKEICQYIHFNTVPECIDFIQYVKKLNYKVGHSCCSGLGCRVFNIDNRTGHRIKKEFLESM